MRFDLDSAFGVHQYGMLVRSKRAEILSNNIANVDTPAFKARDIDFKQAIKQALNEDTASQLKTTNPKHISEGLDLGNSFSELLYRNPVQPSVDGNTVDSNIEKAKFTENAIQYQASVQFLSGRIKSLIKSIKGE